MTEANLRKEIVRFCRLIHRRGWIAASDGNVSARLGEDQLLVTPSGMNKGFLETDHLVVTDLAGRLLSGRGRPSSEILIHVAVYRRRPEIQAVIHAHPPLAVALTIAGVSMLEPVLPEVVITLGGIPTASYATPSSPQGPEAIRDLLDDHNALLLERHGSLTLGRSLQEAYNHLEKIEHAAQVMIAARQAGGITRIPVREVEKLRSMGHDLKTQA